ncbi:MAG: cyclase [Dehalococcoidia bacterium]
MPRLFIRHRVSEYDAWRRAYADFEPTRRHMGVLGDAIYRSVADANDVTVTHDFGTADGANAFIESAELRDAMAKAGVVGEPQVWITEPA